MADYILHFNEIDMDFVDRVGGKNAALGEMFQKLSSLGVCVPDGFATTVKAYWLFIESNNLYNKIEDSLNQLDVKDFTNLHEVGAKIRELFIAAEFPEEVKNEIIKAYKTLNAKYSEPIQVAVRSSATAEDLPTASFAGQQETYLNIKGEEQLLEGCKNCYASLFTDRAIKYRHDNNFEHMKVGLSVGVQKMVRSDKGSAGVCFTLDTETGFKNIVFITGSWGLGENIVQGNINPDEFYVFKPTLEKNKNAIINKKLGTKAKTMIYADENELSDKNAKTIKNIDTPEDKKRTFSLTDEEITKIAKWSLLIEKHYDRPMDIEWAKDGITEDLFIVQARPETVHSSRQKDFTVHTYKLKEKGKILAEGRSIGSKIASGKARILNTPEESEKLQKGEVLITDMTNPDWDPILKKASAIITNKGGRTSHAAIVAREIGAVAVVGTGNATEKIKDGEEITVCCSEGENGIIYEGLLNWEEQEVDTKNIQLPKTKAMLILGDPDQAFRLSFLPNNGVGLMRLEFIINNSIKIHPMALIKFDKLEDEKAKKEIEKRTYGYINKESYFIDKLSYSISTIAAAFYPKEVIVRMSDFKTNEYANLIGGKQFEPNEENPMLGFRGASRYYNDRYKEGFKLECSAIKKVREEMGFYNVKVMIPFCRTPEEGKKVLSVMNEFGLKRGENSLEIYVMAEIPTNAIQADEFAELFDGFSIGSNDLTQLSLGVDRDSAIVSELFNEQNETTKYFISTVIEKAHKSGKKVGLCGQAPSDYPEFAKFLIKNNIDSISYNPDALVNGIKNIVDAEK